MSTDLGQDGRIKRLLAMDNASAGWSTLVTEIFDNALHSLTTRLGLGSKADSVAAVPIGGVVEFAQAELPANFLPCMGQTVSRVTYKELFAEIGTRYGQATADTFRLPQCQGRMIIGGDGTEDAGNEENPIYGGESTKSLSKEQLPIHSHGNGTLEIEDVPDHAHSYRGGLSGGPGVPIDGGSFQDEQNIEQVKGAAGSTGAVDDHDHLIEGNSGWAGNNASWGAYQPSAVVQMGIRAT